MAIIFRNRLNLKKLIEEITQENFPPTDIFTVRLTFKLSIIILFERLSNSINPIIIFKVLI